MKKILIYALYDEDGEPRYVGKTSQYLKQRLYAHINESKSKKYKNNHKNNWIKSMISNGLNPTIKVIDVVPEQDWELWEKYWISEYKKLGYKMTNSTLGGLGGSGYPHTESSKKKMRHAKLGIPLSEEHKAKISKGVKEKADENPNYNRSGNNLKVPLDRDALYDLYITQNLTMPQTADKLNVSETTVFRNLKDYKIKKPKKLLKEQYSTNPIKPVLQYDLEGNLIKEWPQGSSYILRETGIEVARCCRGLINTSKGYIWRYKDEWFDLGLDRRPKSYIVEQYSMDGKFIDEHLSIRKALISTGIKNKKLISKCCKGEVRSAGGFIWKYK